MSARSTVAPHQMRKSRRGAAIGRRCRAPRLPSRGGSRISWRRRWRASSPSAVNHGSTIFRHTMCSSAFAASSARKVDPIALLDPSRQRGEIGVDARRSAVESADAFRPFERVEIILQRQHRRRVDRLAFEDALDELAALGHAEDLRQRPMRRVGSPAAPRHWATAPACRAPPRRPAPSARRKSSTSSLSQADPSRTPHWSRRRSSGPHGPLRSSRHPARARREVVPFQSEHDVMRRDRLWSRSGSSP